MSARAEGAERRQILQQALLELREVKSALAEARATHSAPVAIVGIGCRFPGASSVGSFWELLRGGIDAVGEVPPARWDLEALYDPDPDAPGRTYSRHGGFIEDVEGFDAAFFGVSPREAVAMDPQQRLLLEVGWEALEEGAIAPDSLRDSETGVFFGLGANDYLLRGARTVERAELDAYVGTGNAASVAAGRLSYLLGLRGPSMAVDTACSSSLVAAHLAAQSLRAGECDLALAGGVNLMLAPDTTVVLSRARMLSPSGACRAFDARADGYVRGEGCGVVVLKRLGDALADGDRVWAVIRGSAVNQDGRSAGLTVPNGPAQQALIREALEGSELSSSAVDYVEAHGTGTPLGDPIEMGALHGALGEGHDADRPLVVGSVKTNIGHLEAAAGVAGLIKAALALHHAEIPPHLHFGEPSPHIPWDELAVRIPGEPLPWPTENGGPRVAGVSAFGFSGTNAHMVLESAPGAPVVEGERERVAVKLAARGEQALSQSAGRLLEWVGEHPEAGLGEIAWTADVGRAELPERAAVTAASREELIDGLEAVAAGSGMRGTAPLGNAPKRAFLVPGQGSRASGAGAEPYREERLFRRTIDRLAEVLGPLEEPPLAILLGDGEDSRTALARTEHAQPALYALAVALGEWWEGIGVSPDALLGHSVGAYAAAALAGVFEIEEGARLVAARGRLMGELAGTGAMAAFEAELASVRMRAPSRPLVSDSDGAVLGEEVASPAYWLDHARKPTRFADALDALHGLGCRQMIELGPGREGHLLASAMQAWIEGARVEWSALNRPRPATPPSLPTYPFQHRRHWLPEGEGALGDGPRTVATPLPQQITEAPLSTRSHRYLAEHRVHGHTVVPGVTYLQLLLPDDEDSGGAPPSGITQLTLLMPLIAASDRRYTLQAILDPATENGAREGRLYSREPGPGDAWTLHATATIGAFPEPAEELAPLEEIRSRLDGPIGGEEFYGEAWHPDFELGESFRLLDRVWSGHGEALGRVLVADPDSTAVRDGIRPELLTLDACAQLLLAAATAGRRPAAGSPALLGAGFERFASRQTEIGDAVWCWARLDDGDPGATGSLLLASDDGECLAEVRGVAFRPVAAETLRRLATMAPAGDGTPARGEGPERPAAPKASELRELGADDRAAAIREYLQSRLGLVLGMQSSELDPERSISDFADSLMLAELKGEVEAELDMTVPLEILFEAPTLAGLASWLSAALGADSVQEEQRPPSSISPTPASGSMSVAELSGAAALDPTIAPSTDALSTAEPRAVLLTGATEHVGAYTLAELLARTDAEVHCLLGERDPQRALEAIAASMRRFELDGWDRSRVFPVFGDLPSPWLGLGEAGARKLAERLDAIYHLASASQWARSFATLAPVNVDGTREVLRLATSARPLPVHHFSTVGVFSSPGYGPGPVAENEPLERSGDLPLPYAQTRWVAERMVQTAGERGLPVTVHRAAIGPAAGTGAFDPSHHIPLMLKACVETGAAPEWDAPVQLAPVDYVAGAIVELSLRADMRGRVFHLVTPEGLTWNELGELLRAFGYRLGRESPHEWSERLEATQYGDLGLLNAIVESIEGSRLPWFDCAQTLAALDGASLTRPPLDELLALSLPRMIASGFLAPPAAANSSPLRTSTPALDQTERTD